MAPYLEAVFNSMMPELRTNCYDHSYSYAAHLHSKLEVFYCFRGIQTVRLGEITYSVREGEALVMFPNMVHEYVCDKWDYHTHCIVALCSMEYLNIIFPQLVTHRPIDPLIPAKNVSPAAAQAFGEMRTATAAKLLGWIHIALDDLLPQLELIPVKRSEGISIAPTLTSYIDANFQKPLTIQYLAKQFGYSESHIANIFCSQLKVPFRTYLNRVRSEYAAQLIRTTDKSMTEIAYESGYSSPSTFNRCFKKRFSVAPSEYKLNFDN